MLWDHREAIEKFFPVGEAVETTSVLVFSDWLEEHDESATAEFLRLDAKLASGDSPEPAEIGRWLAAWPNEDYTCLLVPRDLVAFRVKGHCLYCGNRESNECEYRGHSKYSEGYAREWNPYLDLVFHRYHHRCGKCEHEESFEATETCEVWDKMNGGAPGCPGCLPICRD